MKFLYRAYRKDGLSDIGELEANSKQDALRKLTSKGLSVFELGSLTAQTSIAKPKALRLSRVSFSNDRVDFMRLFADLALLTEAGLTVTQSLRSMRSTETSAIQQKTIACLLDSMNSGANATASFTLVESIAPESLAMISSGENAGRLKDVFGALAAQYEAHAKLKSQLLNALAYPLFLLVLMLLAILALTFVLVPSIAPIFDNSGQSAPFIVEVLSKLRKGLSSGYAIAVLVAALLLFVLSIMPRFRTPLVTGFQRLVLRLPVTGSIIRKLAQARYLSSFALLIGNGASMTKALELSASATAIEPFRTALLGVRDKVSAGERLPSALENCGLFDQRIVSLIAVGDESNRLAKVTTRAANLLESEVQAAITRFTAMLTPVMTIIMGLLVGWLVVSVMTALLSINEIAIQ